MPKGPSGQWRPVGANECAALVCRISLGESPEMYAPPPTTEDRKRVFLARASAGGKARAEKLTPERRREIAAGAAAARDSRKNIASPVQRTLGTSRSEG